MRRRLTIFLTSTLAMVALVGCAGHQRPDTSAAQLSFGVNMAKRGLWSEAQFRFEQARRLDPGNPRILNNLAVAAEALGDFDAAQRLYQEALRVSPNDAETRRNYARFVEFYQSFRPPEETAGEGQEEGEAAAAQEESASGDGRVLP
jgi:Flp pilus assembly protein TadD